MKALIAYGLLFFTVSYCKMKEQTPLLCSTSNKVDHIRINHDYNCSSINEVTGKEKHSVTVLRWRQNNLNRDFNAIYCRRTVHVEMRRCFFWFAGKDEKASTEYNEPITTDECISINVSKHSSNGILHQQDHTFWSTENTIRIPESSCVYFNTWYSERTINVQLFRIGVEVDQSGSMSSSITSMSSCLKYERGSCYKSDNTSIVWNVDESLMFKYVATSFDISQRMGRLVVSDNGHFAVVLKSYLQPMPWNGEVGNAQVSTPGIEHLFETNQGLVVSIMMSTITDVTKFDSEKKRFNRARRSLATTDEVSATLQYIGMKLTGEIASNFVRLARVVCDTMEMNSKYLMAASTNHIAATAFARKIMSNPNLFATASGDYLSISSCYPINRYRLLPMNDTCTRDIPIIFYKPNIVSIDGIKDMDEYRGYLEPETRVINHYSEPIGCDKVLEIVVDFTTPVIVNGKTAAVNKFTSKDVKIYNNVDFKTDITSFSIPQIHGVDMKYFRQKNHLQEMQDNVDTIKKTFNYLNRMSDGDERRAIDPSEVASNIFLGGLMSALVPDFSNNPLLRILIIFATVYILIRLFLQFFMPFVIDFYFTRYFGAGRLAEAIYKKSNHGKDSGDGMPLVDFN